MTEGSASAGRRSPVGRWSPFDALLAVAFGALWIYIALVNKLPAIDVHVADTLPPRSGPGSIAALSWPARIITDLGEPTTWTTLTLVIAVALALVWQSWQPVRLVALPVVVEAAIVLTLKAVVHRDGPPGELLPRMFGYFPSGHTATAFVCTGALASLLAVRRPGLDRWLRTAVVGWALLMAASLVYYRYHWLTDVIGSLLLGLLILRLLCRALWAPRAEARPSGDDPAAEDDPLRLREDA